MDELTVSSTHEAEKNSAPVKSATTNKVAPGRKSRTESSNTVTGKRNIQNIPKISKSIEKKNAKYFKSRKHQELKQMDELSVSSENESENNTIPVQDPVDGITEQNDLNSDETTLDRATSKSEATNKSTTRQIAKDNSKSLKSRKKKSDTVIGKRAVNKISKTSISVVKQGKQHLKSCVHKVKQTSEFSASSENEMENKSVPIHNPVETNNEPDRSTSDSKTSNQATFKSTTGQTEKDNSKSLKHGAKVFNTATRKRIYEKNSNMSHSKSLKPETKVSNSVSRKRTIEKISNITMNAEKKVAKQKGRRDKSPVKTAVSSKIKNQKNLSKDSDPKNQRANTKEKGSRDVSSNTKKSVATKDKKLSGKVGQKKPNSNTKKNINKHKSPNKKKINSTKKKLPKPLKKQKIKSTARSTKKK